MYTCCAVYTVLAAPARSCFFRIPRNGVLYHFLALLAARAAIPYTYVRIRPSQSFLRPEGVPCTTSEGGKRGPTSLSPLLCPLVTPFRKERDFHWHANDKLPKLYQERQHSRSMGQGAGLVSCLSREGPGKPRAVQTDSPREEETPGCPNK